MLIREFFGLLHDRGPFINVTDGGHFENLGLYELVRRRCQVIIVSDASEDRESTVPPKYPDRSAILGLGPLLPTPAHRPLSLS